MADFSELVDQLKQNNRSEAGRDSTHTREMRNQNKTLQEISGKQDSVIETNRNISTTTVSTASEDIPTITAPTASEQEESRDEQKSDNKRNTLLEKLVGASKDTFGAIKDSTSAIRGKIGGGIMSLLKGTLFAGLLIAAFAFLNSPLFDSMIGFIDKTILPALDNFLNIHKNLEKYDRKVLEAMFDAPTLNALDKLGGFMKKLENSNVLKTLNDQTQIGPAIKQLINQKETKKIADALDLIKNHTVKDGDKTLTGFNTPLGQSFHNAILDELFKTSTVKLKNKSQLNLEKYREFIQGLKDGGIFETFDKKTQGMLENIDLVKDFIVQGGDAGTSLEIASLAEQFRGAVTGRSNLRNLIGQLLELRGIGFFFTNDKARYILTGVGVDQAKPSTVSRVAGGILSTLVLAPEDGTMEDLKFILDIGKAGANIVLPESLEFKEKETTLPNEVSRLSNPNLIGNVSPVGFAQAPAPNTGAVNTDTLTRGQQLFTGPGEITFAAKGGIMNTKKAFQRVA